MFQHPVQTMRSFCARSVGVVDGSDEEGDGDDEAVMDVAPSSSSNDFSQKTSGF